MLVTSIFTFTYNIFYPIQEKLNHLGHNKIHVRKCFQFGQG